MTITALPAPPTRSDPVNFASRADAFLAALPTFTDEANELATAMNLNATTDTSASSVTIGTGSKSFSVSSGKSFQLGMYLVIANTAAPSTNWMVGQVTAYAGSGLTVDVKEVRGSGTLSAWTISQSAPNVDLAYGTHAATDKATPVDADELPLSDSAATFGLKKLTWANLKATLAAWINGGTIPGSFTSVTSSGTAQATTVAGSYAFRAVRSGGGDRLGVVAQTAGNGATLLAVNDAEAAYAPLNLDGSSVVLRSSGTTVGTITSTGLAVTGEINVAKGTGTAYTYVGGVTNGKGQVSAFRTDAPYVAELALNPDGGVVTVGGGLAVTGALSATGSAGFVATFSGGTSVGIYSDATTGGLYNAAGTNGFMIAPAANNLYWTTNSLERMRLDASGNLGLGVTPSGWAGGFSPAFQSSGGSIVPYSTTQLHTVQNGYFDGANWKYIVTSGASNFVQDAGVYKWLTAPSGTAGNAITFVQAMTLDASGNLWVGPTAGGNNNFITCQAVGNIGVGHVSGTGTGVAYGTYYYNGTQIGSITQSGTTAVAYNTTSDHRLKESVRPADAARFMDIEFVDFEWIDGRHDCGVIADQLQSVYPDLVLGEKDATEVRTVEITPAVPAVTEQVLVTPAVPTVYDGDQIVTPGVEAIYETVEVTPAIPAVTEEQVFPVYQQVNYMGLIGRMGTRVQQLQRTVDSQAALIAAMEARLTAAGI